MPQAQSPVTSQALRCRFQQFFEAKQHAWKASDGLVPRQDPTVLFTSAGMNQFKDYFLGRRTDLTRAASCQKCVRIGDLDNILGLKGHHTFFEMLGNFSFGDYFKREAIAWGWEFLTGTLDYPGTTKSVLGPEVCLSLDPDTLWVSVYTDDDEAAQVWQQDIGMPASKIKRLGAEDNFWPANAPANGPNGPCGPCSEIYARVGARDLEVWNLVFTQFDREADGQLKPLPQRNIDTGMGLERLAQVVNGATLDYDTDLFAPIVRAVGALDRAKSRAAEQYRYTVADHIRAAVFLIGDGVMPGKESREYIVRLLIRRAVRYGVTRLRLNVDASGTARGFTAALVPAVLDAMCQGDSPYAALRDQQQHIQTVLEREEQAFLSTMDQGTAKALEFMEPLKERVRVVPAEIAFKLHDTFGLPLEVTEDIAKEELQFDGVDHAGFAELMAAQQERSRAGSKFGGAVFTENDEALVREHGGPTRFVGYDATKGPGTVRAIIRDGQQAPSATATETVAIVLDQTPFYGESGGQVGDTGMLQSPGCQVDVLDTQRAGETIVHHARMRRGTLTVGDTVEASVDAVRRLHIMRNHTATHILHSVLRDLLGTHVQQRGSLVAPERLRFDFTHPTALDAAACATIELEVNRRVMQDDAVESEEMGCDAARAAGALACFGDTYGEQVRVLTIDGYSKELCGGTHLPRAGQVGPFKCIAESSIAAGVRRIEAVTGERAAELMRHETNALDQLASLLSRSRDHVIEAVEQLLHKQRTMEKHVQASKRLASLGQVEALVGQRQEYDGVGFIVAQVDDADADTLRHMADQLRQRVQNTVVVLGTANAEQKVSLIMAATPDLVKRGYRAGQCIKPIAQRVAGSGGGRNDLAQAGGKNTAQLPQALQEAPRLIMEHFTPA